MVIITSACCSGSRNVVLEKGMNMEKKIITYFGAVYHSGFICYRWNVFLSGKRNIRLYINC